MREGYGSLYDSYRLSNSSVIPLYQGSNAPEALQVAQYNQQLYDAGQSGAGTLGTENTETIPTLDESGRKIADKLQGDIQSKLAEFAKRGDYEHLVPQIQQMGQRYAMAYKQLSAPVAQYQDWKEKTLNDKDRNLTPEQKATLSEMALSGFKGYQVDGNGRISGSFSGPDVAKNIDINKWIDDRMQGFAVQEGGDEVVSGTDGDWIVKNGEKFKKLLPGTIQKVVANAMQNDPTVQSFINMQGQIAGFRGSKTRLSLDDIADTYIDEKGKTVPNYVKQNIVERMKTGISFQQAYADESESQTRGSIASDAMNYAVGKYAQNSVWTTQDKNANPYHLEQFKHDLSAADHTPFMGAGPNMKTTTTQRDLTALNTEMTDLSSQSRDIDTKISHINAQLGQANLKPETRTQLQLNLAEMQKKKGQLQLWQDRDQQVLDYSRDRAAGQMGYTDYEEFKNSQRPIIADKIKKQNLLPSGLIDKSGNRISTEDVVDAMIEGRVKPVTENVDINKETGLPRQTVLKGVKITGKDGKTYMLAASTGGRELNTILEQYSQDQGNKQQQFQSILESKHKEFADDFSIKTNDIAITDETDQKAIKELIGAGSGVKVIKPGDPSAEVDMPSHYEVEKYNAFSGPNGESIVTVRDMGDDGKTPGDESQVLVSNSNIQAQMANRLSKYPTDEAQSAANLLRNKDYVSSLTQMRAGEKKALYDAVLYDGTKVKVHVTKNIVPDGTGGNVTKYSLVHDDGTVGQDKEGNQLSTDNMDELLKWIQLYSPKPKPSK